jgi:hypothetical protein
MYVDKREINNKNIGDASINNKKLKFTIDYSMSCIIIALKLLYGYFAYAIH